MAKKTELVIKSLDPNKLFYTMLKFYSDNKDKINPNTGEKQRIEIYNEGSARSGKSFDTYDLIVYFCFQLRATPISVYVVRKTLKSAREIAYKEDFVTKLKLLGIYDNDFAVNEMQSPEYRLWGSVVKFRGLDDGEELGMSDIIYFNEATDNNNEKVMNNQVLRCKRLAIYDWNPKLTNHFLYEREGRFNTLFTKSTFLNNKHLSSIVRGAILSACPWDMCDYDFKKNEWKVPESDRKPNTYNIENGTANKHDWLVYGEGVRCPADGAVFYPNYINYFPEDCEEVQFALDFGYTEDPSVLTRNGRRGDELFVKYETYESTANATILWEVIFPILEEEINKRNLESGYKRDKDGKWDKTHTLIIPCDSADKYQDFQFVRDLNAICVRNSITYIQFIKVKKPMIVVRIGLMLRFKINVYYDGSPLSKAAENEYKNYVKKVVDGITTSIPVDNYNHGIDSTGYCCWFFWRWHNFEVKVC